MRKKKETNDIHQTSSKYNLSKTQNHNSIIQKHEENLEFFKKKEDRLRQLDMKIKLNKKEVELMKKNISLKILNGERDIELESKLDDLQKLIDNSESERSYIVKDNDKLNYILESSKIIMQYIELEEKEHR